MTIDLTPDEADYLTLVLQSKRHRYRLDLPTATPERASTLMQLVETCDDLLLKLARVGG